MSWDDKRPLSPHLQIYKLPLSAKLSILHRGTGGALFFGLILMVTVLLSISVGGKLWQVMQTFLSSWFGYLILIGFTFSLYYHLFNGIRHLFWDIGKGLELKQANQTGIAVLVASIGLTIITWLVSTLV
jgi:succinate dehydrogenase / fumarate reductase cytochrome b subunit